jgi:lactoylglutathione lyase
VRIEHVALWTDDLERARAFYVDELGGRAGERYDRPGFSSYFVEFADGARLELMQRPNAPSGTDESLGWTHVAFALGSEGRVDELTDELRARGHRVVDGPRRTGDGYYESVVLDPDGNRVELTV